MHGMTRQFRGRLKGNLTHLTGTGTRPIHAASAHPEGWRCGQTNPGARPDGEVTPPRNISAQGRPCSLPKYKGKPLWVMSLSLKSAVATGRTRA